MSLPEIVTRMFDNQKDQFYPIVTTYACLVVMFDHVHVDCCCLSLVSLGKSRQVG